MDPCEEARDGPVMEQIGRLAVVAKDRLPEHLAKMHESLGRQSERRDLQDLCQREVEGCRIVAGSHTM